MFKPRTPKAAQLYNIAFTATAGTAVRQKTDGFLEVAVSGTGILGFLAADVRDWNSRNEVEILFPDQFFGHYEACEWINKPLVKDPTKIGVRIGAGHEYEVQIDDNLVPGDELVVDGSGQLIKKPLADGRTTVAVVKERGTGVGLPLDYRLDNANRVWIVRTLV